MKIYQSYLEFASEKPVVVTIGTFDGVHIGHQEIIRQLMESAQKNNLESVILTFFPHPRRVLQKGSDFKLLTTLNEKIDLLKSTGLNHLIIQPFTKEFSRHTALEFARDILVNRLNTKTLVIGYDHHFGRNREGNFEQLQLYGETYGFDVQEIAAQDIENVAVSSTKIRNALNLGEVEKANSFLGFKYMLTGSVVSGKALGRQFNYPTVNLKPDESYKLIPLSGVYVVETTIAEDHYYGIMNIGKRPTVDGRRKTIEIHLFDFEGNLYGATMQINLLKRLRDEQKFASIEQLFAQIKKDEHKARELIKSGSISL